MSDPVDRGPAPASPWPWTLDSDWTFEARDADGHLVAQFVRGGTKEQHLGPENALAAIHRVNGWDALVSRCEAAERERDDAREECHAWRAAIESQAYGPIPSHVAARAAVRELLEKIAAVERERDANCARLTATTTPTRQAGGGTMSEASEREVWLVIQDVAHDVTNVHAVCATRELADAVARQLAAEHAAEYGATPTVGRREFGSEYLVGDTEWRTERWAVYDGPS